VSQITVVIRRVGWLKLCPHCHRKRRLSQKSATVAENGEKSATVALALKSTNLQFSRCCIFLSFGPPHRFCWRLKQRLKTRLHVI